MEIDSGSVCALIKFCMLRINNKEIRILILDIFFLYFIVKLNFY